LESTSEGDVFGLGGYVNFMSHDGNVLKYTPYAEFCDLSNTSPVPLMVTVDGDFPEVTKSGFGRPKLHITGKDASAVTFTQERKATVGKYTVGKGYTFDISGVLQPGGRFRMTWTDLDKGGPVPDITVTASDDWGGLGEVQKPTERDVAPDDAMVDLPVTRDIQSAAYPAFNWGAPISTSDNWGLGALATALPPGIIYDPAYATLQNDGTSSIRSAMLILYMGGGQTSVSGSYDGNMIENTRFAGIVDLTPGATFKCQTGLAGRSPPQMSYGCLMFSEMPYELRYDRGIGVY